ncbi:hypothetical protein GCM10009682_57420 [Luedemannella flava]|uniref:Uncharacterized protein n=1 Tax=Luedemannella flava TaxID=349316 RepID=A0ABP4YVC6_9ACTN
MKPCNATTSGTFVPATYPVGMCNRNGRPSRSTLTVEPGAPVGTLGVRACDVESQADSPSTTSTANSRPVLVMPPMLPDGTRRRQALPVRPLGKRSGDGQRS